MKYISYKNYEPSKSVWLDQLPSHWQQLRVKHVIERMESGVSVNSDSSPASGEEVGVLKTSCVYGDQFSPQENKRVLEDEIERVACPVKANRLIVSRMNTPELVGSCGYASQDFPNLYLPDRLWQTVFSKSRECLPRFAWYYLTSRPAKSAISSLAAGTSGSMQNIAQDAFSGIGFPLPPLEEQQTIARFLDAKTAQIDELIAKKRQLIDKLKEKRQALIARTVTRGLPPEAAKAAGLEPNPEMRDSGVEWLGEIPVHWQAMSLRRLIKFVKTGNTPSGAEDHHFEDDGFNWYSPSDFSENIYLGLANRTLSAEGKTEVRVFPKKTVMLVGIGATIGKVGLSLNESACNQQINAIGCNSRLDPTFAAYYLKILRDFIVKCGKFTTMPIINQDETKNLIFTVPPYSEQLGIATYIDRETAEIDRLVIRVDEVITRLTEYRQALITSAVTGKIDVRGLA
jgi:Restriction endonuclease S subunits